MNVFLHNNLNSFLVISCQFILSCFVTHCSLFDKQLKPILVLFDRVKIIPLHLASYCLLSIALSTVNYGAPLFIKSHIATAVVYLLHMDRVALL